MLFNTLRGVQNINVEIWSYIPFGTPLTLIIEIIILLEYRVYLTYSTHQLPCHNPLIINNTITLAFLSLWKLLKYYPHRIYFIFTMYHCHYKRLHFRLLYTSRNCQNYIHPDCRNNITANNITVIPYTRSFFLNIFCYSDAISVTLPYLIKLLVTTTTLTTWFCYSLHHHSL